MDVIDSFVQGMQAAIQSIMVRLPIVALAVVVFGIFLVGARLVRSAVSHRRFIADDSLRALAAGLASGAMIVAGISVAVIIAVPAVSFTDLITSLGVGGIVLGLALRDILENFVAGIIILARRPFGVGAQIRSGDHEGQVVEINFRSTVLRTYDGLQVFIPNGSLLTQPVENLTSYGERRSEIELAIHQDASVEQARATILQALLSVEDVLRHPAPLVFFTAIGDSSNHLSVLYWTRPPTRLHQRMTASAVTERLYLALIEADIEFPYPIQTIRIERAKVA